eukprot:CAMPEP_0115864900 /NCGR_PEP_ID=MMETSP0287-20121206/19440_1 /TAXON_ID=412157 /ORGANISM="Chrysochromulina rotalis, Strain UIO044" /LENGTH=50 /DNA_ID=CAMNT_0003319387 /DNA_START=772 /DNA_END=921 /DNA_ORIENTATION=+
MSYSTESLPRSVQQPSVCPSVAALLRQRLLVIAPAVTLARDDARFLPPPL